MQLDAAGVKRGGQNAQLNYSAQIRLFGAELTQVYAQRYGSRWGHSAFAWWGDRLLPGWRPPTRDQNQAILDRLNLTGDFWRLPG